MLLNPSNDAYRDRQWHILDVGSIWMKEFASAMSRIVPSTAWEPIISNFGMFQDWIRTEYLSDPVLTVRRFPLQRGYARGLTRWITAYESKLLPNLMAACIEPSDTPLICSTPYYAPLAEKWPGPVVYYATDLTFAYAGVDPAQVLSLDRRLCHTARSVCPNSSRIADYFIDKAYCDPHKITIVPNATRLSNISSEPLFRPSELAADLINLKRPIAGVIGNLSGNMDWLLLAEAISLTPGISWLFVGPTTMPILDHKQASAREWVKCRATFVGSKPYSDLQSYARAFDVAILPYMKKEPTYSGSSTRFYEHLAACRPMIATRGFAELLEKVPLVTLVDTAQEMQEAIFGLESMHFTDGFEQDRWTASRFGTWESRAMAIIGSV